MKPTNISRLFNCLKEINRRQVIPALELPILEERLALTFRTPKTVKPGKQRGSSTVYKRQYAENKGREVYLQILEEFPHLFIPFVLTFKPKACEKFNIAGFRSRDNLDITLNLKNDQKGLLEDVALKYGFDQNPLFLQLINLLFQGLFADPSDLSHADM
ncbi:hypothetical protein EIK77_000082 [Talaromyces pinophilus]|nr:hypothetical protein EIK77_000082 [Talaromyces pinophilus]